MSVEFTELIKKIDKTKKAILKHNKVLNGLLTSCTHEETKPESYYLEGGYYDRSSNTTWDECVVCGKRFNVKTETGGYA